MFPLARLEEADGWGTGYMAPKYQAMPEDADRPVQQLSDTKGEELPRWVIIKVMEAMKEDITTCWSATRLVVGAPLGRKMKGETRLPRPM